MYPPALVDIARRAEARLASRIDALPGALRTHTSEWLDVVFDGAELAETFTRSDAFPMLLLPWWVDSSLGPPDDGLHTELAYSTMNGYLYVRLLDNVMDADGPGHPGLLPILNVFHSEFLDPYRRLLPDNEAFWDDVRRWWFAAADATLSDAQLSEVDRPAFEAVAARKTIAAAVPVSAVCHLHGQPPLLSGWVGLIEAFGKWHQMLNDMSGAFKDIRHGHATYYLFEATRRGVTDLVAWSSGDGLEWGMAQLDGYMGECRAAAANLESEPVLAYLEWRQRLLTEAHHSVAQRWEAVRRISAALEE